MRSTMMTDAASLIPLCSTGECAESFCDIISTCFFILPIFFPGLVYTAFLGIRSKKG